MNVLITGHQGYVGSVLVPYLRANAPALRLVGVDTGWFANRLVGNFSPPESQMDWALAGDIREISPTVLAGFDAVVHLAAVSNDPMGRRFEEVTRAINEEATIRLATYAKRAGVRKFVFASSCSVYGAAADGSPRSELSDLSPQTAYARSKIEAERRLVELGTSYFHIYPLRFATACGSSPRPRLDLVVNDFVAAALSEKQIVVLSDGSPWRPLIHVHDMCRAILWALLDTRHISTTPVNVGSDGMNFRIEEIADEVARQTGVGVTVNKKAAPDTRSYRVDFSRFRELAPDFQPEFDLARTVEDLLFMFKRYPNDLKGFRDGSQFIRLNTLVERVQKGDLDDQLRWTAQ